MESILSPLALAAFQWKLCSDLSGTHCLSFRGLPGNVIPKLFFQTASHRSGAGMKTHWIYFMEKNMCSLVTTRWHNGDQEYSAFSELQLPEAFT